MRISDYIIEDDDDEYFTIVCENGCPEGYLGRHKFSCKLARTSAALHELAKQTEDTACKLDEFAKAFGNNEDGGDVIAGEP